MVRQLTTAIIVAIIAAGASGCASNPCDRLRDRICEAGGAEICDQVDEKRAAHPDDDQTKAACDAILKDERKLERMREALMDERKSRLSQRKAATETAAPAESGNEEPGVAPPPPHE